jgi:hypothetical protein
MRPALRLWRCVPILDCETMHSIIPTKLKDDGRVTFRMNEMQKCGVLGASGSSVEPQRQSSASCDASNAYNGDIRRGLLQATSLNLGI